MRAALIAAALGLLVVIVAGAAAEKCETGDLSVRIANMLVGGC